MRSSSAAVMRSFTAPAASPVSKTLATSRSAATTWSMAATASTSTIPVASKCVVSAATIPAIPERRLPASPGSPSMSGNSTGLSIVIAQRAVA
ncbi:MAG: hypothetical protein NTX28_13480 [Novosphingobium sp.]|nr:hypothetical protein [Novosphingobium sp.]